MVYADISAYITDMQKNDRHRTILNLIAATPVERQDELVKLLTEKGFSVTQASVSRDLERLRVVKVDGRYVRQTTSRFGTFGPISVGEAGDNLIVIKCGSGLASAAAVRIDSVAIPEIVGTIAGDDTIFIAVKGAKEQARVIKALVATLEAGKVE
jgi:transcriptional regulator of arginine metabolism